MRQDFFEFTPQFKLLVIGNHKPGCARVDEAIRRRLHLMPFTVTIPPDKRDKTSRQAEGRMAGDPALDDRRVPEWQRHGLNPPKIVQAATDEYLASEDSFSLWLDSCATSDPQKWEPSGKLWDSWRLWAGNAGEPVGSQKAFANLLVEHGFVFKKLHKGRGYYGAKLHSTAYAERA